MRKNYLAKLAKDREEFQLMLTNFSYSDVTELQIEKREGELLYLNVKKENTIIYIGFMLTDAEKTVNFIFSGMNNRNVLAALKRENNKNFYFFEYLAAKKGEYTVYLQNKDSQPCNVIIFVNENVNEKGDELKSEKLDKISLYLKNIDNNMNEMRMKQNIVNKQAETHNRRVNANNKSIIVYAFLEVFTMIIVFIVQSFYIRKIVSRL